jgi:hypothetical protein
MNTAFTSTAKLVAGGKKIAYAIFADGTEIGTRTTSRSGYAACVVARRSYASALSYSRSCLESHHREVAKYQGYLDNPAASIAAEKTSYLRDNLGKWIKDGTVQSWIDGLKQQIVSTTERIAALEGMTQDSPEFQKWIVLAYTNTGKLPSHLNVWTVQVQLVPLATP